MKLILLAAVAMLAVPALAQTTTAPTGGDTMPPEASTPTTADPQQTTDPATTPAPGTSMGGTQGDMTTQSQTMPAPSTGTMGSTGAAPMGGYQPAQPPMTGQMSPGVAPTFQAAPSPSEAYPAPAPMAKYPICKKGQYDNCMQRGGR